MREIRRDGLTQWPMAGGDMVEGWMPVCEKEIVVGGHREEEREEERECG